MSKEGAAEAIETAARRIASAVINDERRWRTIDSASDKAEMVDAVMGQVLDVLQDWRWLESQGLASRDFGQVLICAVAMIHAHASGKRGVQ